MKRILSGILAFLVGVLPAFLVVFNSVFLDSNGSLWERILTYLLVIFSYGFLGFIFGYTVPKMYFYFGILLSIPAFIILALYFFMEGNLILLSLSYMLLSLLSSCFGAYLGRTLRQNRSNGFNSTRKR